MRLLLSDQSEYSREYDKATYSTKRLTASEFKKVLNRTIISPAILWILFFLMLTVLVKFL